MRVVLETNDQVRSRVTGDRVAAGRPAVPQIFSTLPPSSAVGPEEYLGRVAEVSRWSEEAGLEGMLVYTDNSLVDPWLLAQIVVQNTTRLAPLVAVQPVYMHPYSVAKIIASIAQLHGRRVYMNMVAGGFKKDLESLGDPTPHDERYDRLAEYTEVVLALAASEGRPVTYEGAHYRVEQLKLGVRVPAELQPGVLLSGSSDAGKRTGERLGATMICYPSPDEIETSDGDEARRAGIRVGILAREDEGTAWGLAHERFPTDRRGQLAHKMAMKVSDSSWHQKLSDAADASVSEPRPVYWLEPFQNYKTFCPYLVGDYDSVARELARYLRAGFGTFILDVPTSPEDLAHTQIVFRRALELAATAAPSAS